MSDIAGSGPRQLHFGLNKPETNLSKIQDLINEAKKQSDIEAVFLPEVFYSMSDGTQATSYLVEKDNEHYKNIQNLAKENSVYLIGGTAATKNSNGSHVFPQFNFQKCFRFCSNSAHRNSIETQSKLIENRFFKSFF